MRATFKAGALAKVLEAAARITSRKDNVMPMLNYVHTRSMPGNLVSFNATDLDSRFIADCPATIDEPGDVLLSARRVRELASLAAPMADVHLSVKGDAAVIEIGTSRVKIPAPPVGEFPAEWSLPTGQGFVLPPSLLRRLIERARISIPTTQDARAIQGVQIRTEGNVISMVACSPYQASFVNARYNQLEEKPAINCVVPRVVIAELEAFVTDSESADVGLFADGDKVFIADTRRTFIGRLLEERMPDIARAIPKDPKTTIVADRDLLKLALQRAAVVGSGDKHILNGVSFTLMADQVVVQHSSLAGESDEIVPATVTGDLPPLKIQIDILMDFLRLAKEGDVSIAFTGDSGVICCETDPTGLEFRFLASQMRV
jgi:DNA polymerase-3 subunit beta